MKSHIFLALLISVLLVWGCSLPPERAVTKDELFKTGIYTNFTVKESPESVLAALNREGEAVIEGKFKGKKDYYIKILATTMGLKVHFIEK
jgi:hypothetical protein